MTTPVVAEVEGFSRECRKLKRPTRSNSGRFYGFRVNGECAASCRRRPCARFGTIREKFLISLSAGTSTTAERKTPLE